MSYPTDTTVYIYKDSSYLRNTPTKNHSKPPCLLFTFGRPTFMRSPSQNIQTITQYTQSIINDWIIIMIGL